MTSDIAANFAGAMTIFLTLVLPPLGAAMIAGLIVAVMQAATQIQDQNLPQTIKLLVVVGVFAIMAGALFAPLMDYSRTIYTEFYTMVR